MRSEDRAFLEELLTTPSPSGFEIEGQRVWARHVRAFADQVDVDAYGNTWARLPGATEDAPRLMIEAHADEIGFMVSHVTDKGFLHITRIGGSDAALARSRRVRVFGDQGPVPGVIGITAIHLRDRKEEKVPDWHEITIDIGAASREEVAARGIRVGHAAVFTESVDELAPGRLIGRALDNRIGGYIIAKVLERLAAAEGAPAGDVVAVNAVQEELGGYGARMVTYRLRPSVALVIDVTHATDTPGIDESKHGRIKLGAGPSVTHGSANHPLVVQRLLEVAEAEGIDLQHEASSRSTGTDTDDVFVSRQGVPAALVSLPMRYMHSTVEMVALDDVERTVRLLAAFARHLRADDTFVPTL